MGLERGDVVIVDLDPTAGSEQRGRRPCVVVQNDVGNANAPTTIVVPFTTSYGESRYPFEVLVPRADGPLREDSVAQCSQIRTVSIEHRIGDTIGSLPESIMADVDEALEYSLGLRPV